MRNTRLSVSLVFAATLGFVLGNCGGSSSSGPKVCPPGGSSTCTQAELNQYSSCISGKCGSMLKTCFGAGSSGGTCGATYVSCQQKCACGDTACFVACGQPTADCQTCLQGLSACVETSGCTVACSGGSVGGAGGHTTGPGGTSGTCADLLACCNSIADSTLRAACMSAYGSTMAQGDTGCGAAVTVFRSDGLCP